MVTRERISGWGGVILAAVASGVAHAGDLGFVQVGRFVLFFVAAEAELINEVDEVVSGE